MSPDTEEKTIIKEAASVNSVSFKHELHTQYRLLRKKLSAYLRCRLKKPFINVLYITVEDVPAEYILSLQKQYPDKIIEVLILHTPERSNKANLIDKFEYQMKNNSFTCELYEYPLTEDNIKIYGISTDGFENLEQPSEIYQFKYLAHFSKCVRLAARKIKADIIHSENIPFYLGSEFCSENYSAKVFQTFHHYPMFANTEPFWAAINLADKKVLKRIINDKIIRKNLAALFGIRTPKGKSQTERCLDCFYKNFEDFRNNVDKDELVNENILIKRLNDRIIKMFPPAFPDNAEFFDIIYYSVNRSGYYGFYSSTDDVPEWITNKNILRKGYINTCNNKVFAPTDINNFRETKDKNKKYLIKEFASERIQIKFVDTTLYEDDSVKISGYLDYFYRGVLILAAFGYDSTDEEIKTSALAILKCFEKRKNIQVIFNVPSNFKNKYFESLIEYMSKEKVIQGKWMLIEGKINLTQFTSSADIILLPSSKLVGIENILYTALKNGCIPILSSGGVFDAITDIYDDMNIGCGFKSCSNSPENEQNDADTSCDLFTNTLLKALSFHLLNSAGWNKLINNAMQFDSGWNFELIEQYNNIYNEIV